MLVLHVDITLKPGESEALARTFKETFEPAISAQTGFLAVNLLHALEGGGYLLNIVFESEDLRVKWADSDLHQKVWPMMESHFDDYTIRKFLSV